MKLNLATSLREKALRKPSSTQKSFHLTSMHVSLWHAKSSKNCITMILYNYFTSTHLISVIQVEDLSGHCLKDHQKSSCTIQKIISTGILSHRMLVSLHKCMASRIHLRLLVVKMQKWKWPFLPQK